MMDAPVSGGEPKAIDGTLSFMVGGKQEVFDRFKPVLESMGASVVLCGDVGAGNTTKLANQIIVNLGIAAVSEAFVLAAKAGADPEKVYQAIRGGLAGSTVMNAKAPMMMDQNFEPGFRIDLHIKDLKNVVDAASAVDAPIPLTQAVLEMMNRLNYYPDILHAHDWQAALSVVYLNCLYRSRPWYGTMRTVFTIHNIEYQGQYDFAILGDVFALSGNEHALMEYNGCINLMKAAIECADRVTTVSPRYAWEIRTPEYAHGLDAALNRNAGKLSGILNGIDYTYYDPATDPCIAARYSVQNMEGKGADKLALQRETGLPERADVPMLAVISRLAAHKGLDLITGCIYDLVAAHELQLVILGKGEFGFESFFRELQERFPDKVRALITYDRDLSKRVYAAADIFLMPSRSEPCGLSQMIASRYGAIPVVRETGGLYDSIKPYWVEGETLHGNGFTFANYSAAELRERTEAAIGVWYNKPERDRLVERVMTTDFSWRRSAGQYLELYEGM